MAGGGFSAVVGDRPARWGCRRQPISNGSSVVRVKQREGGEGGRGGGR